MLTLAFIFRWLLISASAGVTARLIYPRLTQLSGAGTVILGLAGTLLGGVVWYAISGGEDHFRPCGWFSASIASLLLLVTRWLDVRVERQPTAPWNWVYHL